VSAAKVAKWRALAMREGKPFPPPGPALAPGWTWVCALGTQPAHVAYCDDAPMAVQRKSWGWGACVRQKALRVAGTTYYADGRTGAPAVFASALEASEAASAFWLARGAPPMRDYVQLAMAPGLRWERCAENAGEGKVWLRPAFVAVRVDADAVLPWPQEKP
jgi:hypothetical protein